MKIENKKAKDNETLYYIIMWQIFAFKSSNGKFRLLHLHTCVSVWNQRFSGYTNVVRKAK